MNRMNRSTAQNRGALFSGARAPSSNGYGGGSGSTIYDDETAKAIESHNNAQQAELHQKILALKSVRNRRESCCCRAADGAATSDSDGPIVLIRDSDWLCGMGCVQVTQDLHGEILQHNRLLSSMDTDMSSTNNALSDSLGKLSALASSAGSVHVCQLAGFAVVVFVLLYMAVTRW